MRKTFTEFRDFCFHRHNDFANQKYDDTIPYSFHLKATEDAAFHFLYVFESPELKQLAMAGAVGHDLYEDGRYTYNDCVQDWGKDLADVIYGCTESTGRNRDERKDAAFFKRLTSHAVSVYDKLCDIIANTNYTILTFDKKRLADKRDEWENKFKKELAAYNDELTFAPMFKHLDYLYAIKI